MVQVLSVPVVAWILKSTVILLTGLGAGYLLRSSAANVRHLVLSLTATGLLILPLATAVLPALPLDWLPEATSAEPAVAKPVVVEPVVVERTAAPGSAAAHLPRPAGGAIPREASNVLPTTVLPAVFLLGCGLLLTRLAVGIVRCAGITRRSRPIDDDPLWQRLTGANGRSRVRLVESQEIPVPMTWGVLRPVILLPVTARTWSAAERHQVLLHEHSHVERWDWLLQMVMQLVAAIYWFHPLAWLVRRQLLLEAERACDDRVLLCGARAGDYAEQLLGLARGLVGPRFGTVNGLQMARPHQLQIRIDAVLDHELRRFSMHRSRKLFIACCSLITLVLFAQLTLTPAAQETVDDLAPLPRAVADVNPVEVQRLLESDPDAGELGQALLIAAALGQYAVVDRLLSHGADPDFQASHEVQRGVLTLLRTPLTTAARAGHTAVVERLIDAGADVDLAPPDSASPLMEAAGQAHRVIVDLLITHGADVGRMIRGDGTPLIKAAGSGDPETVARLLNQGADPNVAVKGDGNPLIAAARAGDERSVRMLIDAGADPNTFVPGDESPMYHAARSGNTGVVLALLDAGADVDAEIPGDGNALIVAARNGNSEVVEKLLERGARADVGVAGDGNALIMAARRGDYDLVKRFMETGADVNASVRGDGNPLIMAAASGHLDVVELLVDGGADIDQVVRGDENALMRASEGGHLDVVEFLLGRGADVNIRVRSDGEVRTALWMARRRGHDDVAELLLSRGATD